MKTFAIGDVHGCYDALKLLVQYAGISPNDQLVMLGDYVDRGPDSYKVIEWLIQTQKTHRIVALKGNHEVMMLEARTDGNELRRWMHNGGSETLRSYSPFEGFPGKLVDVPKEHWDFMEQSLLPYFESESAIFVHANLYYDVAMNEQPEFILYWEKFESLVAHRSDQQAHFSGKTMICGHTSQKNGIPKLSGNAVCIDTWACGGGWLTCLDVDSKDYWQANMVGDLRRGCLLDLENFDQFDE